MTLHDVQHKQEQKVAVWTIGLITYVIEPNSDNNIAATTLALAKNQSQVCCECWQRLGTALVSTASTQLSPHYNYSAQESISTNIITRI
jgi:hypothetical protein